MNKREEFLRSINYDPLDYPFGADEKLLEDEIKKSKGKKPKTAKRSNKKTDKQIKEDGTYPFSAEEILMQQEDAGLIH